MKVALLTSKKLNKFEVNVSKSIFLDNTVKVEAVIRDCSPSPSLVSKFFKNIARGRGGYTIIMALSALFNNDQKSSFNSKEFSKDCEVFDSYDLYSNETTSFIKNLNLDALVLINGFGIIKESILNISKKGIVSYHHGDMRKYRGMPSCFWELYNGEAHMGVTVQLLDKGLDSGKVLLEKKVIIKKNDNLKSLTKRAYSESTDMMLKALLKINENNGNGIKLNNLGKLYTLPNLRQWFFFKFKLFLRYF